MTVPPNPQSIKYVILDDGAAIKCTTCGMTSHNPNDVRFRYCGNCHTFHDTPIHTAVFEDDMASRLLHDYPLPNRDDIPVRDDDPVHPDDPPEAA
jgi:hypothetical protein